MMTADEILEEEDDTFRVSQAQATRMLIDHDTRRSEFYEDCGKQDSYPLYVVLKWLGY